MFEVVSGWDSMVGAKFIAVLDVDVVRLLMVVLDESSNEASVAGTLCSNASTWDAGEVLVDKLGMDDDDVIFGKTNIAVDIVEVDGAGTFVWNIIGGKQGFGVLLFSIRCL